MLSGSNLVTAGFSPSVASSRLSLMDASDLKSDVSSHVASPENGPSLRFFFDLSKGPVVSYRALLKKQRRRERRRRGQSAKPVEVNGVLSELRRNSRPVRKRTLVPQLLLQLLPQRWRQTLSNRRMYQHLDPY